MSVVKMNLFQSKCLSCALLTNVKNSAELRKEVISGNVQCTVIKPSHIIDLFQIYVAANKALLLQSLGKLTTKSIYTEILFNLSVSKNISQSLLKFGIGDADSELLVVSFGDDSEVTKILATIEGDIEDMAQLSCFADEKVIRKAYKISDNELSVSSLINIVVSKISTKDFANH